MIRLLRSTVLCIKKRILTQTKILLIFCAKIEVHRSEAYLLWIGWKHNLEPESLSPGTLFCGNESSIISGSLILIISAQKNTSPTYYTCQNGSWVTSQREQRTDKSQIQFTIICCTNHELQNWSFQPWLTWPTRCWNWGPLGSIRSRFWCIAKSESAFHGGS